MVIYNLDVRRPRRSFVPFEANPPLTVDADAELSFAISAQGLEAIAGRCSQIFQHRGGAKMEAKRLQT